MGRSRMDSAIYVRPKSTVTLRGIDFPSCGAVSLTNGSQFRVPQAITGECRGKRFA